MKTSIACAPHVPQAIAVEHLLSLWLATGTWLLIGGSGSLFYFLEISEPGAIGVSGLVVLGWLGLMAWGVRKVLTPLPADAPRRHLVVGIWAAVGFSQLLVAGVALVLMVGSAMESLNF